MVDYDIIFTFMKLIFLLNTTFSNLSQRTRFHQQKKQDNGMACSYRSLKGYKIN